jgi:2-polyprenyl-3-methyl-5-hydroxy-6-metoxy-1,4-benzoquinol methylase
MKQIKSVEQGVQRVYQYCPPTETSYTADGRAQYAAMWGSFLASMGLPPSAMAGRRLLDVGCGSAEKATFYDDWGAQVTGIEMTSSVFELARKNVGSRQIRLIHSSLFDLVLPERFDIVVSDGVLHHTADTRRALDWCVDHLEPNGLIMFSLVNIWGSFWWFKPARGVARLLGGSDYHARARWGQRLFGRFRSTQEGSVDDSGFYRSASSWAYDWFANPRWSAHRPAQVRRWLQQLGLEHVGSVPPLVDKPQPTTVAASLIHRSFGSGPRAMGLYWLASGAPNMFYVVARKSS